MALAVQALRRRTAVHRSTMVSANSPSRLPRSIAPPPPEDEDDVALLVVAAVVALLLLLLLDAALTSRVVLAVPVRPALSVTVRLTVTWPAAVGSSVAVDAVVELVMLAMLLPLVIAHS